jgi:hypothetical protein
MKIKWVNTYSGESGYVKAVNSKDKFFESTQDEAEARVYMTRSIAKGIVTKLESYGEGLAKNNTFEIIA